MIQRCLVMVGQYCFCLMCNLLHENWLINGRTIQCKINFPKKKVSPHTRNVAY